MPQVSKYPLSKDVYERIMKIFLETLAGLKSKKEIDEFLEDFISPTEKIMLAKRLAIGVMLAKEYDYRTISRVLRVSLTTIGKINALYRYGSGLRKVVQKILVTEKMEEFWQRVDDVLFGTIPPKGRNWYYWRKEKEEKKREKRKPF